jgi:tetratricopeptide (TPR) repeat protein
MDKRIYVTAGAAVVALPIIVLGIKKLLGQLWPGDESVPQHSSDPLEEEGIVAILHEKANELAHNNEYDKCVMVMKDCIQECINKYGEQSIITVRLLKEYASHLLRLKREESIRLAVETVDRTVLIIQLMVEDATQKSLVSGEYNKLLVETHLILANYYYENRVFKDALTRFEKIASIWEQDRKNNLLALYQAYNTMADIQDKLGFYKKAQELLEQSLQLLSEIYQGQERPEMSTTMFTIAQHLLSQGSYEQALIQCQKVNQMYKNEHGEVSEQVVKCLQLEALIYKFKRELDNMEQILLEAYDIQTKLNASAAKSNILPGMRTLHQLALYFLELRVYEKVIEYCTKCLEQLSADDQYAQSVDKAAVLHTLSSAWCACRNFEEAKQIAEQELAIMYKQYGEGARELAETYGNLATIYLRLKDRSSAIICVEKELKIMARQYGENHVKVVRKRQQYSTVLNQISGNSNSSPGRKRGNLLSPHSEK